jgi:hypothetical protein
MRGVSRAIYQCALRQLPVEKLGTRAVQYIESRMDAMVKGATPKQAQFVRDQFAPLIEYIRKRQ